MTKLQEEPPLDWADILLFSADPELALKRQDMGMGGGRRGNGGALAGFDWTL